jgi:carboxylesterase
MTEFIPGAAPVFIKGNKTGFLFIHGFTATPHEGKDLVEWLHSELGITAAVPLLKGHGTRPEDLLNVTWKDWYSDVENKYSELLKICDNIYVCGQSMGAALALKLAARQTVSGLITLAGAVFLKDWRLSLLPLARNFITFHYKSKGPDIKDREVKPKIPTYRKYPVKSIDELLSLFKSVRNDLASVTTPALLIHSKSDRTVHFSNLEYIMNHISSAVKEKLVLEESYHVISIDVEKERIFNRIKDFINNIQNNYHS